MNLAFLLNWSALIKFSNIIMQNVKCIRKKVGLLDLKANIGRFYPQNTILLMFIKKIQEKVLQI